MEFFSKPKQELIAMELEPKDMVYIGSAVEILRDIREKIDNINHRLVNLERKLDERVPEKALSEQRFVSEIQDGNEIVETIIKEVRDITKPLIATKEKLTIVETRRMEKIIAIMKSHEKLNALQLGQILGLSRTRSNEYLKQMEGLGIVEGELLGKERYYRLKGSI